MNKTSVLAEFERQSGVLVKEVVDASILSMRGQGRKERFWVSLFWGALLDPMLHVYSIFDTGMALIVFYQSHTYLGTSWWTLITKPQNSSESRTFVLDTFIAILGFHSAQATGWTTQWDVSSHVF